MIKTLLLVGSLAGAVSSAMAISVPINGSIDFAGDFTLADGAGNATSNFLVATQFSDFIGEHVNVTHTGSYASVPTGTAVTFTPFVFDPAGSVTPLWTFTVGTTVYSFNLTSFFIDTRSSSSIHLIGNGTAFIDDGSGTYSPTDGLWDLSAGTSTTFHFSAGNTVPDGGATAMLLGVGLLGLGALRRKA